MSFARRGKEDSQKKERPGKVSDTTARGVIGMMVLIFIFQAVTFTIHKCSDGNQPPSASNGRDSTGNVLVLFEFDPNTISLDSLQMLGFSYKQALTVIHYREKGGRFRKKEDFSKVEFLTYDEGLCVQCMHIGSYDDEPATVALMHAFMEQQGYTLDITDQRFHHEIYLSDARKVAPEKLRTVIRHPIRRQAKNS